MPTPEELARINIDKQLTACGWVIQDLSELKYYASLGVVAREVESAVEKALARSARLRQSVLKSAFEGRLV